ncbi:MAG: DUF4147 domain-containing protein [Pirellulales bacterium]|nr:DUF4147 domain-containing protein [Pirellulales bacterium]
MRRTSQQLREDAQRIWWAGVQAVQPQHLLPEYVTVTGDTLCVGDREFDLRSIGRIIIVGAGKAGASMTLALEETLGKEVLQAKKVDGWVNVPADCVQSTRCVHLHAARPAGVNEPTDAGVAGTKEILRLVGSLRSNDLCLCVISGGGSALLPAPVEGLSLQQKVELTRAISARGGSIEQLNAVRRELSEVKGGGLACACRAGHLVTLILSDVLGDDLETIASGPTIIRRPTPQAAVNVLHDLDLLNTPAGQAAQEVLGQVHSLSTESSTRVTNLLIGNNATAVDAAGIEAERLGYSHAMLSATGPEATAEEVAQWLAEMAQTMRGQEGPDCLISGGEPTVKLVPEAERGRGGRNQQLVLSALASLKDWQRLALLSGGTDGEDGPTNAAGAVVNEQIVREARRLGLEAEDYLSRNDAYHFFEPLDALLKTGPTHTNVCDLRVITVSSK